MQAPDSTRQSATRIQAIVRISSNLSTMILAASSGVWSSVSTIRCCSGYGKLPSEFIRYLPCHSRSSARARSTSFLLGFNDSRGGVPSRASVIAEKPIIQQEHLCFFDSKSRTTSAMKSLSGAKWNPQTNVKIVPAIFGSSNTREKASKRSSVANSSCREVPHPKRAATGSAVR